MEYSHGFVVLFCGYIIRLTWWRHQMETFSALLTICAGNSPVTGEFPEQRPVTLNFDVFFDLPVNKRLSKQSWGWWFEKVSRSFWRHSNEKTPKQLSHKYYVPVSARVHVCLHIYYFDRAVHKPLTHWGRATHICVGNLTIIGSDNGLSPGRRQAII